ncbi:hypothetical protein FGIG_05988 [Fasciola gigantica]|uniref:Uncharacterized protein n=1 Tax=Fasciola gigantica TaxID=46835 RepID=A0A504XMX6_FASGI|nr:hypothetical protein FGIG_05988 [Fasciola gigantica]
MSTSKVESEHQHEMETAESPSISVGKFSGSTVSTSSIVTSSTSFDLESESSHSAGKGTIFLRCPAGPDDSRQHPELPMFGNPFEKIASVQRGLCKLINNHVEVRSKVPSSYPD